MAQNKIVNIPNVGVVAFPDSMADSDVTFAIEHDILRGERAPSETHDEPAKGYAPSSPALRALAPSARRIREAVDAPVKQMAQGIAMFKDNPLAGGAQVAQGTLGAIASPFTAGSALIQEIPVIGKPLAGAIALPFEAAAKIASLGEEGIRKLVDTVGVPKAMQNLGLSDEHAKQAAQAVSGVNQTLAQFLVGAAGAKMKGIVAPKVPTQEEAITKTAEEARPKLKPLSPPRPEDRPAAETPETVETGKPPRAPAPPSAAPASPAGAPLVPALRETEATKNKSLGLPEGTEHPDQTPVPENLRHTLVYEGPSNPGMKGAEGNQQFTPYNPNDPAFGATFVVKAGEDVATKYAGVQDAYRKGMVQNLVKAGEDPAFVGKLSDAELVRLHHQINPSAADAFSREQFAGEFDKVPVPKPEKPAGTPAPAPEPPESKAIAPKTGETTVPAEKAPPEPSTPQERLSSGELPLAEAPPEITDKVKSEATVMAGELTGASRESHNTFREQGNIGAGYETVNTQTGYTVSTYPEWYKDIQASGEKKAKILKALEDIKNDDPKYALAQKLKAKIVEHLSEGRDVKEGRVPADEEFKDLFQAWQEGVLGKESTDFPTAPKGEDLVLTPPPEGKAKPKPAPQEEMFTGENKPAASYPRPNEGIRSDIPLSEQEKGTMFEKKAPAEPGLEFAMGAAAPAELGRPVTIEDMTSAVTAVDEPSVSPMQRINARLALNQRVEGAKGSIAHAWENIKSIGNAFYNLVANPPEWSNFKKNLGEMDYANQRNGFEIQKFVRETKKRFSPIKLEAMVNWIQANGDESVLTNRARESTTYKKGYEEALKLTADEKVVAQNLMSYFDARLEQGMKAGILRAGIENYISQIWDKPNAATNRLTGDLAMGKLPVNFKAARQRIFESYFEGEQLGFKPKIKNAAELVAVYDQAFNRVLSARSFVRQLHDGLAKDGRPYVELSGIRSEVPESENTPGALLIKPRMAGKTRTIQAGEYRGTPYDISDYKPVDHPSLRGWKWAGTDEEGRPILYQSDMLVHPEIYENLKNNLGTSWFRQNAFPRAILHGQAFLKGSKLGFSNFHAVQEGLHAVFHRVNPFGPGALDFDNPVHADLVKHGLTVADYRAMQEFTEGQSGGGWTTRLPIVGKYLQEYNDWLFKDYIPRLKMTMADHAFKRNTERYGNKLSRDQILELTASQSNAAFGELNYKWMGRNPNLQDFMRTTLLAPDFLEARARFVGQALTKYGGEQRAALMLAGTTLYVTGRILNQALDGDPHWTKPFSVVFNGKEYSLRSVLGDVQHMITDPRSFAYNRLSPIIRTATEAMTGRDDRGIRKSAYGQFKDFVSWAIPISVSTRSDQSLPEMMLSGGAAITNRKYRSAAENKMTEVLRGRGDYTPTEEQISEATTKKEFAAKLAAHEVTQDDVKTAIKIGLIGPSGINQKVLEGLAKDNKTKMFERLTLPEAKQVFETMTDAEKKEFGPAMRKKMQNAASHPGTLMRQIANDPNVIEQSVGAP